MKNNFFKSTLAVICLLLLTIGFCTAGTENVQAAKYHNCFVKTKSGVTYFYNRKGQKLKKTFFTTKTGNTYYFDKKGHMCKGWKKIKKKYYYFSEKGGKMMTDTEVDGIHIRKNGTIKDTQYNIDKIKELDKAKKVLDSITSASDSREAKLSKCFNWIMSFPYHQYRKLSDTGYATGWEITFANDIFNNSQGCCVSEAAAFAFLARECGYTEVYVCNDTGHGWTEIDGYVYDPLFAEAKDYNKYYRCTYSNYGLSPVGGRVKV